MELKIGKEKFEVSNPNKILFPQAGITKLEMVKYYVAVAPYMLPHLKDRVLTLKRYPHGVGTKGFFQKTAEPYYPKYVKRVTVKLIHEGTKTYMAADNVMTLAFLANHAVIPIHTWLSRKGNINRPDMVMWDLDPSDADFEKVREGAYALREYLQKAGMEPWVKTTGSRGLHLVVPIKPQNTFLQVRNLAKAMSEEISRMYPKLFTTEMSKAKRGKKVFVDYLRNGFAQTAVAPYSLRTNDVAGVAMPIAWEELADKKLNAQTYTLKNALARLKKKGDLWQEMYKQPYALGDISGIAGE